MKLLKLLIVVVLLYAAAVGPDSRILNGSPVNPDVSVAHNALVLFIDGGIEVGYGGGSIISSNAILTSASNIVFWQRWRVGVGSTALNSLTYIESTSAIMYPRFIQHLTHNDIGIIFLPTRLQFSASIQPIAIPASTTFHPMPNEELRIMGFGVSNLINPGRSEVLNDGFQRVTGSDTCAAVFLNFFNPPFTFCGIQSPTGFNLGNTFCYENIGGGATMLIESTNTLVGIATIDSFNCDVTRPDHYTYVALYRGWIVEMVGQLMV